MPIIEKFIEFWEAHNPVEAEEQPREREKGRGKNEDFLFLGFIMALNDIVLMSLK